MKTTEDQQRHEQELETAFIEAYVKGLRSQFHDLSGFEFTLARINAEKEWLASESRRLFCNEKK